MPYEGYDTHQGLLAEGDCFNRTLAIPATRERMAAFLRAGGQTRAVELDFAALVARLGP